MLYYKFEEGDTNIHKGLKKIKKKFHVVLKQYRGKQFYTAPSERKRKELIKASYRNKVVLEKQL